MDEALNTRLDDARALYESGVFGDGAETPTAMSHEVLLAVSPERRPGLFGERWWSGRVVSRASTHDRDEVDVQVIEDGQPSITDAPPDGEYLCCTQSSAENIVATLLAYREDDLDFSESRGR
jgi:hypothetical protein